MKSFVFITLLVLLAGACQSNSHTDHADHIATGQNGKVGAVADLEKHVLATHDSVMPAMGELMRLRKAVLRQAESETKADRKKQGRIVGRRLDEADQLMMDWMHHYNGDTLKALNEAQSLSYLREQQSRISAVRDRMRQSMSAANEYLKQTPQ